MLTASIHPPIHPCCVGIYFPNVTRQHIFQLMVPFLFLFIFWVLKIFAKFSKRKKKKKLNFTLEKKSKISLLKNGEISLRKYNTG
jgi:hypothetical protein